MPCSDASDDVLGFLINDGLPDEKNNGNLTVRWRPTSKKLLATAENKLLAGIKCTVRSYFVPISNGNSIHTIDANVTTGCKPALVLIHGFGAGVAQWWMNIDGLSKHHTVYALDLLGFGRSSRPQFPSDSLETEEMFVRSIEDWRSALNLDTMILCGHSFGAYLSSVYAMHHPHRVKHLILTDPWGIPHQPPSGEEVFELPFWMKVAAAAIQPFNPLALLRVAGPLGPRMLRRLRPDLEQRFVKMHGVTSDMSFLDYVYHINAQKPSGETAFKTLTLSGVFAKHPLIDRLDKINSSVAMTILYGSHSWMDATQGAEIKRLRRGCEVDLYIIKGASHQLFADCPDDFNSIITHICRENTEVFETDEPQSWNVVDLDEKFSYWLNLE